MENHFNKPKSSFRYGDSGSLVDEFKAGVRKGTFSLDSVGELDAPGALYGRSSDPNKPREIFAKDPGKHTDNFAFVTICEDEEGGPKSSFRYVNEEEEAAGSPESIRKYLKENLIRDLKKDLDKDNLDKISIETTVLGAQLNKFIDIKNENFKTLTTSLDEASKILNAERNSMLLSMLRDLSRRGPFNNFNDYCEEYWLTVSDLDPEERKSFLQARGKLERAAAILEGNERGEGCPLGDIHNLVLDAITLWPQYTSDERVNQIIEQILPILGASKK